jgi:hypothetical protein
MLCFPSHPTISGRWTDTWRAYTFHVQVKGVAATTPDLVNSPFPQKSTCHLHLHFPRKSQITVSGVPSLSGLPLVAGQSLKVS